MTKQEIERLEHVLKRIEDSVAASRIALHMASAPTDGAQAIAAAALELMRLCGKYENDSPT